MKKMKVLYVCRANVGRSQMAKAFHNFYTDNNAAASAGTHVNDRDGQLIGDYDKACHVWEVMDEEEINVRGYRRTQLNEEITLQSDRIIVFTGKEDWPDYLTNNPDVEHWDVKDPKWTGYDTHVKTRNDIKARVMRFLEELL